jgi:hypothetical protein
VHPLRNDGQTFWAALAAALADPTARCQGGVFGAGAILRLRSEQRRIWSPALFLHVDVDGSGASTVHGRFSASSPVWTAFVAIYIALACVAVGAACYGGAQILLDETPWAFAGVPIALALAAFTCGAAFIGQGLGAEDMYELRSFVERVADSTAVGGTAATAP